ncbi:hypothetical protein GF337_05775 [candidate division KSB1 bacterium]|nr:hypothetical protein [candidate division KSB1 bacterium]
MKRYIIFIFPMLIVFFSDCRNNNPAEPKNKSGYKIIYDVAPDKIFIMNEDGSDKKLLLIRGRYPKFSPDRQQIGFYSNDRRIRDRVPLLSLCVSKIDSSDFIFLGETIPREGGNVIGGFDWSYDSEKIVYSSSSDGSGKQIYIINADGTGCTKLTNSGTNFAPMFFPDAQKIFYITSAGTMVMNIDGSDKHKLMNLYTGRPSFSPDGTKMVFSISEQADFVDIYIANTNETNLMQLTNDGMSISLGWSPNSNKIIFDSGRDGGDLYSMNPDGSEQKRLTNSGNIVPLIWISPDGEKFAYALPTTFEHTQFSINIMTTDGRNDRSLGIGISTNLDWYQNE